MKRRSLTPLRSSPSKRAQTEIGNDEEDDIVPLPEGPGEKTKEDGHEEEAEDVATMDDDEYTTQSAYQAQMKEDINLLVSNFTPEQAERYNIYRETAIKGVNVKKVLAAVGVTNVPPTVLPLVGGVAKVFVGEMVEMAREVQKARGDIGPLGPEHLREAYSLYYRKTGRVGPAPPLRGKRLFTR